MYIWEILRVPKSIIYQAVTPAPAGRPDRKRFWLITQDVDFDKQQPSVAIMLKGTATKNVVGKITFKKPLNPNPIQVSVKKGHRSDTTDIDLY